jgi:hypothetical protein
MRSVFSGSGSIAVERGARVELAALLAERPPDDDTALSEVRQLVDPNGKATQQRLAAVREPDRDGARAVERRPDECRLDLIRYDPRARNTSVGERAGKDPEAVAGLTLRAADEARREGVLAEAWITLRGLLGVCVIRRLRNLQLDLRRDGLRHEAVRVEDAHPIIGLFDLERAAERRRRPQRHLGHATQEPGDETAGVASVRRACRPVEARVDDELFHGR